MLSEADAGAPRRVAVGEAFEVALDAQLGTGFSWRPSAVAGLVQLGEPRTAGAERPGGAETQRFRFKATAPGRYVLEFVYGQPWAADQKGARRVGFTIEAR